MALATVVIASRNRKDELLCALKSCVSQTTLPEIIVVDDGSSDGTSESVRQFFPKVRLIRHERSVGYISSRNEGALAASGEYVFSIDDDAEFSARDTIAETLADFTEECIGAVAIPYVEPAYSDEVRQFSPTQTEAMITNTFKGTAYAVDRKLFLKLGGFRDSLLHQGEESDYCIRMLEQGYYVRLGTAAPITHNESPKRNSVRMDYYGVRNAILFIWQNVPASMFVPFLFGTTIRCMTWTGRPRRIFVRALGVLGGLFEFLRSSREPVSNTTFCLFRELRKKPKSLRELKNLK
ncbi:glycosyltransferase family 2 protein [Rubripirellula reticaptiva]|uniref:Putative glycosyl transferase n=1 Tax=Rubripirellula reticaptiva TaxID=2528013 RepID=A0A5C6F282_9BACT|nr:glycosyltransferase [Rubripirellula reticaptiva]TWU55215.1 putative glycosyl transferase [Rubripirellula reticaptiva]